MARRGPSTFSTVMVVAFALGFIGWTWALPSLRGWDERLLARPLTTHSAWTQVLEIIAGVTWPGVIYAVIVGLAAWAWRRRLRNLTAALLLAIVLSYGGYLVLKRLFHRARPEAALDVITARGFAYPSGHMAAIATLAVLIVTTTTTTRQSARTIWAWRAISVALVALVAVDRWATSAHWASDIVGGFLWGGFAATLAVVLAGVHIIPDPFGELQHVRTETRHLAAVIFNPAKVLDVGTFRRHVAAACSERGWRDPLWIETTRDDPGHAMARYALEQQPDLVLVAGGDGTVRVVCSELAGSGVPVGLVPAGTGNLLARNLGIPLDEPAALDVAFEGRRAEIDLVKITIDDDAAAAEHSAVMAGLGVDAIVMAGTNPELKKAVGSAAYFVAAAQHANTPPLDTTITVDDRAPMHQQAAVVAVGNVGFLQANIQLIPDASPTDGLLDLVVASPRSVADWAKIVTRVLTRGEKVERLEREQARRVRVEVAEPTPYQLDGDTEGEARVFEAEVVPGALAVMLPR